MAVLAFILAIILFVMICVGIWADSDGLSAAGIVASILMCILGVLWAKTERNQPVVIKKSSDTEWEIHEGEPKIYQDTTITRVVVTLEGDTCYPTTEYKVLWRDSK